MSYPSNDVLLRKRQVLAKTALCHTTLYMLIKAGLFPKGLRLSARCVAWRDSEVSAWINSRPEAAR